MAEIARMSFDEFRQFLSDTLGITESVLQDETHFLNDLAIDSLKLVELIHQFERRLGQRIPSDAAWEILTVGDAYRYYSTRLGAFGTPGTAGSPAARGTFSTLRR